VGLKVVIDTNVFISSILFKGEAAKLVNLWKRGFLKILISKEVLEEYIKVLTYPKFQLSKEEIKCIIEKELMPFTGVVKVKSKVSIIKEDEEDNKFLTLASEGVACYIISGDKHLLRLKNFHKIPIITVREFLEKIKI